MYDKNGIVLEFCGGMGNKIWQLTAAIIISIKYDQTIYLNKSKCINHFGGEADYFSNIFKNIGTDIRDVTPPKPEYNTYYIPFMISTEKYSIDDLKFPILLNQYFQYYPPIKPYESKIRDLYLNNIHDYRSKIQTNYPDVGNALFIHIRRGDYLKFPRHPIPPVQYYDTCLSKYCDLTQTSVEKLVVYVFSDDMDWVQNEPFFRRDHFRLIDLKDEVETLAFMSLCRKGAICANSSLSWWGAFLGAHGSRCPVFVPKDWILEARIDSLFPDEWIVIENYTCSL
jgi:Glycosyl transferase family 11